MDDERDTLCNFIDDQLSSLRASAYGLDDCKARETPLRSELSISGIIKHVTFVMNQSLIAAKDTKTDQSDEAFFDSFVPGRSETLSDLLREFDRVRSVYLSACRGGDLESEISVGPMPWYGVHETQKARLRYRYVHDVEELARHAGHADIIREQLDGAKAPELIAAAEGRPANEYVTPWRS
ncbi:DUF664 domain-containing protein [Corynebacterium liangguodongii]|uniref:mycothiol transferase n=1 Tax=Corynebacterium liangguodongii TaxID=2079535 RepID=UPI001F23B806|nr:DUF664 domain-containing protein [Corynebacterium liangguodongii]